MKRLSFVVLLLLAACGSTSRSPEGDGQALSTIDGGCYSSTLSQAVPSGTCVESIKDGNWWTCTNGSWQAGQVACKTRYAWCGSYTLQQDVPPAVCVFSAGDEVTYQCDSNGWMAPVDAGVGPLGPCSKTVGIAAPPGPACSTACADNSTLTGDELLAGVDRYKQLSGAWAPGDLVGLPAPYIAGGAVKQMRLSAAGHLVELLDAMRAAGVSTRIYCGSPYRSFQTQCSLFDGYAAQYGCDQANTFSAMPGYSEHQLGTACDLVTQNDAFITGTTSADQFLQAHANEYGFVLSYPSGTTPITDYEYEPWHWRYVGKKAAQTLRAIQKQVGRPVSTTELLDIVEKRPAAERQALETEDPTDVSQAVTALCSAFQWISNCEPGGNLLQCSYPGASLVHCANGCKVNPNGVSDTCL